MAEDVAEEKTSMVEEMTPEEEAAQVIMTINGAVITKTEYDLISRKIQKEKFWHQDISQFGNLQLELEEAVKKSIIENMLTYQEAVRRDVKPSPEKLEKAMVPVRERAEKAYGDIEEFQSQKEQYFEMVETSIDADMRRRLLKEIVQKVEEPSEEILRQFHEENPEKFTQPSQYGLSVILISVDPGAGGQVWVETMQEMRGISQSIRDGQASFEDMAEAISTDISADSGGSMGYQHQGMLDPRVEKLLAEMDNGDVSDPVQVLEGVMIVRRDGELPSNIQPFDVVRDRVKGLWIRQVKDNAWNGLLADLRKNAAIEINQDFFSAATH